MWKAANSEALNLLDCIFRCALSFWETDTRRVWWTLWDFALIHVAGLPLQAGERRSLGWSPACSLPGWFCHRLRLLVQLLEQDTTGEVSWSDRQRLGIYVRNVIQERMGVSVPAQSPAHQLHGLAHGKPGSDESRCVWTQPRERPSQLQSWLPCEQDAFIPALVRVPTWILTERMRWGNTRASLRPLRDVSSSFLLLILTYRLLK